MSTSQSIHHIQELQVGRGTNVSRRLDEHLLRALNKIKRPYMLQVVAFLAMEAPTGLYCDAIRDEQVKVFRTIPPLDPKHLVRGQFNGYKKEKGVAADSRVETFAAVRLEVHSWRWSGCPLPHSRRKVPAGYDYRSAGQTKKASARHFGRRIEQSFPLSPRSRRNIA